MEQKHARAAKIFSNTPLIFQIDLELSELPRNYDILPDTGETAGQTQIEIRLYIVPRKRLGRVNSGESM